MGVVRAAEKCQLVGQLLLVGWGHYVPDDGLAVTMWWPQLPLIQFIQTFNASVACRFYINIIHCSHTDLIMMFLFFNFKKLLLNLQQQEFVRTENTCLHGYNKIMKK